jgi:hypothetical protein
MKEDSGNASYGGDTVNESARPRKSFLEVVDVIVFFLLLCLGCGNCNVIWCM